MSDLMHQVFQCFCGRGTNFHYIHFATPVMSCSYCTMIGPKTDVKGILPKFFFCKLTNVMLSPGSHLCGTCISHMRVMSPNNGPGIFSSVIHQRLQCIEHMAVPKVPAGLSPQIHAAIIFFSIRYQPCILKGIKVAGSVFFGRLNTMS